MSIIGQQLAKDSCPWHQGGLWGPRRIRVQLEDKDCRSGGMGSPGTFQPAEVPRQRAGAQNAHSWKIWAGLETRETRSPCLPSACHQTWCPYSRPGPVLLGHTCRDPRGPGAPGLLKPYEVMNYPLPIPRQRQGPAQMFPKGMNE
ncbi:Ankyrin Repeat Domain-Containing Protein 30B [Manis pentadactyla]|nr:Ankyrin Repeat Domain-Containing Protein 30B [Manis pentadactyla]